MSTFDIESDAAEGFDVAAGSGVSFAQIADGDLRPRQVRLSGRGGRLSSHANAVPRESSVRFGPSGRETPNRLRRGRRIAALFGLVCRLPRRLTNERPTLVGAVRPAKAPDFGSTQGRLPQYKQAGGGGQAKVVRSSGEGMADDPNDCWPELTGWATGRGESSRGWQPGRPGARAAVAGSGNPKDGIR